MKTEQIFSSASAKIQISGEDIGLIQNLSIEETFSQSRMKTLWSRQNVGFVPGTEDIQVTASKAFIELDSILFAPDNLANLISSLSGVLPGTFSKALGTLPIQIGSATSGYLSSTTANAYAEATNQNSFNGNVNLGGVNGLLDSLNASATTTQLLRVCLQGILNGTISLGTLFAIGDFDIVIQGPPVSQMTYQNADAGNVVQTAYGATDSNSSTALIDVFRLKNCRLNSRSIEISTGNVVVMENITAFVRDWNESYWKYATPSSAVSKSLTKLL